MTITQSFLNVRAQNVKKLWCGSALYYMAYIRNING